MSSSEAQIAEQPHCLTVGKECPRNLLFQPGLLKSENIRGCVGLDVMGGRWPRRAGPSGMQLGCGFPLCSPLWDAFSPLSILQQHCCLCGWAVSQTEELKTSLFLLCRLFSPGQCAWQLPKGWCWHQEGGESTWDHLRVSG